MCVSHENIMYVGILHTHFLCVSITSSIFKVDIYFEVEKNLVFITVFYFKIFL